ncbi:MAG: 4Fe-4S binding protein [Deltaproteobacteria bacterium]
MSFQRVTQAATLVLFVGLLLLAAHPFREGLPVDFFLRLDPLIGVGTIIAARDFLYFLLPGLIILVSALFLGRYFCGHICPMGTTLDIVSGPVDSRRKARVSDRSFEATSRYRSWKYLGLIGIVGAAVGGVSLVHLGSPLSLATRLYGLCLYPIAGLLGDSGLALVSPWLTRLGLYQLAYLQIPQKVFATNIFVAALFVGIVLLAYFQPRFWCRNLCPSGALLGLFSRSPLIKRRVDSSCTECGRCIRECPVGAIREDPFRTVHSECIVCLHCTKACPVSAISFGLAASAAGGASSVPDPTRRGMLVAGGAGLLTAGLLRTGIRQPRSRGRNNPLVDPELIRPPGSMPETEFRARCVRCGECMKACPTNTLQPIWLKAGLEGLFTPAMTPRLAACATHCNVCGKVCPTGAIRDLPLVEKQHAKVGTAWIVRENCLVWEQDKKCLVCDEACPYNAISFRAVPGKLNAAPFVVENRCLGCGWCETKCPVEGASAIRVNIMGEVRLASGSYQQKAREYGLVFKTKDNSLDSLAPGTFELPDTGPEQGASQPPTRRPKPELPPGFTTN